MDTANIIDTIVRANEIQLKFIKKEGKNSYNYEVKQGIIDNSTVKYLKDKFSLIPEYEHPADTPDPGQFYF